MTMSAFAYREPYRLSAGVLTLIAHVLFFGVLYMGVNWHVQQPEGVQVDLWASLPEEAAQPAPSAPPVAAPQPVEQAKAKEPEKPAPPAKADIEAGKKKQKPAAKTREAAKPEPKKKTPTEAERKRMAAEMQALNEAGATAEQQDQAVREAKAAQAAAAAAAITSEVGKYKGLISSKIRRNIVNPPDVADEAVAEFVITLLPGGEVFEVKRIKSSGNAAYDAAVERAIWKAKILPLPKDEEARKLFINPNPLRLKFSPKDGG